MEDTAIIKLLFERSEQALQELQRKYEKLFLHIMQNILANDEDIKECLNDTYLAVWNTIPPEKPNCLGGFVCKIAKNQALSRLAYNKAKKRNAEFQISISELGECIGENLIVTTDENTLSDVISDFIRTLNEESQIIFIKRYWYQDPIKAIAASCCISESKVKSNLLRSRNKLKKHLIKRRFHNEI